MLDVHSTAHHIAAKRPVMAVWAIGTVAFIALIVVLLRRFHYPNEDPGESSGNDQRNTQFSGAIPVACNP